MRDAGDFDPQYFARKDPSSNRKKLVEEAIPLSRLGLYLSTPGSEVHVTCSADNKNYDAEIEVTGFNPRRFKVEVTTTETPATTLRREALAQDGHVVLTGHIERVNGQIITDGGMVDVAEEEEERIGIALGRLHDKVTSERYDIETALLVYLTEFRPADAHFRAELIQRTERYLWEAESRVGPVYYCYTADYSIDAVPPPYGRTVAKR